MSVRQVHVYALREALAGTLRPYFDSSVAQSVAQARPTNLGGNLEGARDGAGGGRGEPTRRATHTPPYRHVIQTSRRQFPRHTPPPPPPPSHPTPERPQRRRRAGQPRTAACSWAGDHNIGMSRRRRWFYVYVCITPYCVQPRWGRGGGRAPRGGGRICIYIYRERARASERARARERESGGEVRRCLGGDPPRGGTRDGGAARRAGRAEQLPNVGCVGHVAAPPFGGRSKDGGRKVRGRWEEGGRPVRG